MAGIGSAAATTSTMMCVVHLNCTLRRPPLLTPDTAPRSFSPSFGGSQPPCGLCEGYGGIPFGDNNEDIHLTTCKPVANASDVEQAPPKPVWGSTFTIPHYNEVLIGPKVDPFCFNTAPSNSSVGKLCYRADSGQQMYDAVTAKALRYDLNVKTEVGNITTEVLHKGENMCVLRQLAGCISTTFAATLLG